MHDTLTQARDLMDCGVDSVLAFITDKTGSSPRQRGASMLVTAKGLQAGTIGGGAIEHLAIQRSLEHLSHRTGGNELYNMTMSEASNTGMVCGGTNNVHFTFLPAHDAALQDLLTQALASYGKPGSYLVFDLGDSDEYGVSLLSDGVLHGPLAGAFEQEAYTRLLDAATTRTHVKKCSVAGRPFLAVALLNPPKVHIFGGGHVSRALTVALAPLDFEVHVYEDRPEFILEKDFAYGTHTHLIDFERLEEEVAVQASDYLVVCTRGHAFDLKVVDTFLEKEWTYLGAIGSRNKARTMRQNLLKAGHAQERIDRLYCPIGLPVGDDTPPEIAISIAAQIIQVKSERAQ